MEVNHAYAEYGRIRERKILNMSAVDIFRRVQCVWCELSCRFNTSFNIGAFKNGFVIGGSLIIRRLFWMGSRTACAPIVLKFLFVLSVLFCACVSYGFGSLPEWNMSCPMVLISSYLKAVFPAVFFMVPHDCARYF